MKAFIKAISYYLPDKILTNEELVEIFPEWSVEKIASKIGVKKRHISADNETATDMACKAAEKLFEEHNHLSRDEIDFVILCTQSPDYFLPTSACIIQDTLRLKTSCGAFDFNQGCSGYIYGLSIAKGMIYAGIAKNVLLLTSETYSKYIHPKDKSNRTIFADAATATVVSSNGFAEIKDFCMGTDGKGCENLIVKSGASRMPAHQNDIHFDEGNNPISKDFLFMNGSEIFNFTSLSIPQLVKDVLQNNNMIQEDINLFVFHQANKYMINYLRKLLGIQKDKFYEYLENVGNTVSSTIPIALVEAKKEEKICGNILLAGFGVGYSWGGVILATVEDNSL
jgi:3-oxoacyl-[acyl-carrier-protein] synthase III